MVLWLRYLTEILDGATEIPKDLTENAEICEAIECLQESAFTKEELEHYDKYWESVRVERTAIEDALEEGEKIGIKKVTKNLKNSGMGYQQIADIPGLSVKEIEFL